MNKTLTRSSGLSFWLALPLWEHDSKSGGICLCMRKARIVPTTEYAKPQLRYLVETSLCRGEISYACLLCKRNCPCCRHATPEAHLPKAL